MKLDEAIKHEEELVNEYEGYAKKIREKMKSEISLSNADDFDKYARQHRQLAEWLKELKKFKEQEPFINKPCVSSGVCEHDKQKILDNIRAEIDGAKLPKNQMSFFGDGINYALQIIDKYKAESEENNESVEVQKAY